MFKALSIHYLSRPSNNAINQNGITPILQMMGLRLKESLLNLWERQDIVQDNLSWLFLSQLFHNIVSRGPTASHCIVPAEIWRQNRTRMARNRTKMTKWQQHSDCGTPCPMRHVQLPSLSICCYLKTFFFGRQAFDLLGFWSFSFFPPWYCWWFCCTFV